METRKPNHSNDGELQPINPDGTYAPKDGPNAVDAALEAPGIKGDFSKLGGLKAKAAKYIEDAKALEGVSEDDKKILEAMSGVLVRNRDKLGFLKRLNSLPEKMSKEYRRVILGHDGVPPLKINVSFRDSNKKLVKCAFYRPSTHEVYLPKGDVDEYGPSLDFGIYPAWNTLFHEIGHAIDMTAKEKALRFGWYPMSSDLLGNGEGSLYEKIGEDVKASGGIEEFVKKAADAVNGAIKAEIAKSGSPKTVQDAIKMVDKAGGKMGPLLDFLTAYADGKHESVELGDWLYRDYLEGKGVPVSPLDKMQMSSVNVGHDKSYWDKAGRRVAGSKEAFAELLALMATDKEAYQSVASVIPGAAKSFEGMFDEINDGGNGNDGK